MIKILVEGEGEVLSLPVLFSHRKRINPTFEVIDMKGKANITRANGFERTILRQKELGFNRFAILLDADVFYSPYRSFEEERTGMVDRATRIAGAESIHVEVFWAVIAFESWIVGGLRRGNKFCGLNRALSRISENTETHPARPKLWVKEHLKDRYYGPRIQACLTERIDLTQAKEKNRSLRDFTNSALKFSDK